MLRKHFPTDYCYAIGDHNMISAFVMHNVFIQGLVYDDMMLASALWRLVLVCMVADWFVD